MEVKFYHIKDKDLQEIKDIYNYYVLNTTVTFQIKPVDTGELKNHILVDHPIYKSILTKSGNAICGYGHLYRYRSKEAYRKTAEIGIYLKPEYTGKGIGRQIAAVLEKEAKDCGIKVLLAFICGENSGSINFFKTLNYEKCAHFKRVGEKFGRRLDVVAYQKELL
jgi:L-amino acid N-acyltransferase YncA